MQKTYKVKVLGKVQGVGFRFESYQQFVDLNLVGKAENTPDGGVEIVVTGEEENLNRFLEWAKQGPVGARVSGVEHKETEAPAEEKKS
ncbi:MAG: acylphosphatase [Candidatus Doudnabacteria bacterium]|nr:acylphosphatase [Candidatus Doudnabacteria bacterium]